ncbi:MAG: TerB family tellurite resistance protein [Myxococcales bacterium]|nr:TerB family tellurite resistance protein [Myxococcales bacterium]
MPRLRATLRAVYGKVLGAGIGGCVAMLLGWDALVVFACVVAGAMLGHFLFDHERTPPKIELPKSTDELLAEGRERRAREKARAKPVPVKQATAEQLSLVNALCPIFIEVARADGDVVSDEVRVVREFFQRQLDFDEPGLEAVRVTLKEALAVPPGDIEALVKANRGGVKPALRVEVLRAMYEVVLSDGPMKRAEQDTLKRVVQHFNLSDEQLLQVTKDFFGTGKEHFEVLGLTEGATDDEIRAAFRRLASENHPDRVASLGPKEAEAAAERFRVIKDAWEALRQLRGL